MNMVTVFIISVELITSDLLKLRHFKIKAMTLQFLLMTSQTKFDHVTQTVL